MLFWKEHKGEKRCLNCGKLRYVEVVNDDGEMVTTEIAHKQVRYLPIAPRLKQMFLSERTVIHMWWHKDGEMENKEMTVHPLDNLDVEFSWDVRNVRIGLATDGFTPFSDNAATYFCWPMFPIPYNLPPSLCMKYEFGS
jgi:hypothetical protein